MAYRIDSSCTKCGACINECPTGSIVEGPEQFYIDTDTCDSHAACAAVCPVDAIHALKSETPRKEDHASPKQPQPKKK